MQCPCMELKTPKYILSCESSLIFLVYSQKLCVCVFQHANEDVERMLLGNKCDMEDKRVVPKAKGEQVNCLSLRSHQTLNENFPTGKKISKVTLI